MRSSSRVVINTLVQYARTLINIIVMLWTVRIVLQTLGVEDYGIYTVVAGVVSMLSFVTGALVTTTQRYVSYYQGVNDPDNLKSVFANSLLIHMGLGAFIIVILFSVTPLLFNGFLNIPPTRVDAARYIYYIVIFVVFTTFITSPFRALCVAHENIVYSSIVDTCDSLIKLVLAIALIYIPFDKLIFYGFSSLFVHVFNLLAYAIYDRLRFEECIWPRVSYLNGDYVKGMMSFAGWNVYSTGCWAGRQQGVAIVLNKMMNATTNAAYGIGFQISSYTNFLANAIAAAIQPQIVRSEGGGQREHALWLTKVSCKFSFFLTSLLCIPFIFEIDSLLSIWLKDVPANTSLFCVMILVASMANALTGSLGHINQAVGNIKMYSIIMNTPKLLAIPVFWIVLKLDLGLVCAAILYVIIEFVCAWIRIPFIQRTTGLDMKDFLKTVIIPEIIPTLMCVLVCILCTKMNFRFDFILTFIISILTYSISIYFLGLTKSEKKILNEIIDRITQRLLFWKK